MFAKIESTRVTVESEHNNVIL